MSKPAEDSPAPLSAERIAEIERLLAIGDSVVGDLVDADDVRGLLCALSLLTKELDGVKLSRDIYKAAFDAERTKLTRQD